MTARSSVDEPNRQGEFDSDENPQPVQDALLAWDAFRSGQLSERRNVVAWLRSRHRNGDADKVERGDHVAHLTRLLLEELRVSREKERAAREKFEAFKARRGWR